MIFIAEIVLAKSPNCRCMLLLQLHKYLGIRLNKMAPSYFQLRMVETKLYGIIVVCMFANLNIN